MDVYTDDVGQAKHYLASDNLVDERWTGLPEGEIIDVLRTSGLGFDRNARTGVVPHMLSCLAIDGRFGVTAIGDSPEHADELYQETKTAVERLAVATS